MERWKIIPSGVSFFIEFCSSVGRELWRRGCSSNRTLSRSWPARFSSKLDQERFAFQLNLERCRFSLEFVKHREFFLQSESEDKAFAFLGEASCHPCCAWSLTCSRINLGLWMQRGTYMRRWNPIICIRDIRNFSCKALQAKPKKMVIVSFQTWTSIVICFKNSNFTNGILVSQNDITSILKVLIWAAPWAALPMALLDGEGAVQYLGHRIWSSCNEDRGWRGAFLEFLRCFLRCWGAEVPFVLLCAKHVAPRFRASLEVEAWDTQGRLEQLWSRNLSTLSGFRPFKT